MTNITKKNKDCSTIETIQDVNDLWDYNDTISGGTNDEKWVSCGQDEKGSGYSELKNKFKEHFKGISKEKWIAKLMCQCCKKLKPTGKEKVSWTDFYKCLLSKISEKETLNTYNRVKELIKWHEARD